MDRSVPILALGLVFALGGIALFAFAMRQKDAAVAPKRKSEQRDFAIEQQNNVKMRIAGAVLAVFGAALVILSRVS